MLKKISSIVQIYCDFIDATLEANLEDQDIFNKIEKRSQVQATVLIVNMLLIGGIFFWMNQWIKFGQMIQFSPILYITYCSLILVIMRYGKKDIADLLLYICLIGFNLNASTNYSMISASSFVFVIMPVLYLIGDHKQYYILKMILSIILCLYHTNNIINSFKIMTSDHFLKLLENYRVCSCIFLVYSNILMYLLNKRNITLRNNLKDALKSLESSVKQLEETMRQRDIFFASVNHDLRNPLNSVLGSLEYLESYKISEDAKEILKNGRVCGEILLNLINNLLDAAKLDADKMELDIQQINIITFMDKLWSLTQQFAKKKNLGSTIYISKKFPLALNFDQNRLMQILLNLVSNATKFTDKGHVDITLTWISQDQYQLYREKCFEITMTEDLFQTIDNIQIPNTIENLFEFNEFQEYLHTDRNINDKVQKHKFDTWNNSRALLLQNKDNNVNIMTETLPNYVPIYSTQGNITSIRNTFIHENLPYVNIEQNGYLKIEVSDTGCGISQEDQLRLFKPFSQANYKIQSKFGGTGLGLYIAQRLSKLMGGDIHVYSKQTNGTIFTTYIKVCNDVQSKKNNFKSIKFKNQQMLRVSEKSVALIFSESEDIMPPSEQIENYNEIITANNEEKLLKTLKEKYNQITALILDFNTKGFNCVLNTFLNFNIITHRKINLIILCNEQDDTQLKKLLNLYKDTIVNNTLDFKILNKNQNTTQDLIKQLKKYYEIKSDQNNINQPNSQNYFNLADQYQQQQSDLQQCNQNQKIPLILIVDDEVFNIKICNAFLKKSGFNFISASNGKEALEILDKLSFKVDLILMDCNMPIMNGLDATINILKSCKELNIPSIPIFGLSGNSGDVFYQKCIQSGMKLVLYKPIEFKTLIKAIHNQLNSMQNQHNTDLDFKLGFAKII